MNYLESNCGNDMRVLRIHAPECDNESPVPVRIKVVRTDGLAGNDLPALLSRPRCRQKTRETVAPAPRQFELVNA
jgi:hypothetical protein